MNDTTNIANAAEMAQYKFALIAPVIQGFITEPSNTAYYKRVTEKPLTFPDGSVRQLSHKTLEKWVSRDRCTDACLKIRQRNNAGTPGYCNRRDLPPEKGLPPP